MVYRDVLIRCSGCSDFWILDILGGSVGCSGCSRCCSFDVRVTGLQFDVLVHNELLEAQIQILVTAQINLLRICSQEHFIISLGASLCWKKQ